MTDNLVKSRLGYEYDLKDALRHNPTIIQAGDDICAVALDRIEALEAEVKAYEEMAKDAAEPFVLRRRMEQRRKDKERDALEAENARLRYVLGGVAAAIDTGRNEPLVIWREH